MLLTRRSFMGFLLVLGYLVLLTVYVIFSAKLIKSANNLHTSACSLHVIAVERFQRNWCDTLPNDELCVANGPGLSTYRYCKTINKE